jgi:RimJ/RimL family protein N-acetyltransferase
VRTEFRFNEITMPEERHGFRFRPLDPASDALLLHRWFAEPRARFWGMQDMRVKEVAEFYAALIGKGHAGVYLGLDERGTPAFLIECYDPAHDEVGEHYAVQPGDLGMHVFVAPARQAVHGYTRRVFAALLHFMFDDLGARRVVVEPDRDNTPIHALNRAMGFVYTGQQAAFRHKTAALAFCTPSNFHAALSKEYPPCPA